MEQMERCCRDEGWVKEQEKFEETQLGRIGHRAETESESVSHSHTPIYSMKPHESTHDGTNRN